MPLVAAVEFPSPEFTYYADSYSLSPPSPQPGRIAAVARQRHVILQKLRVAIQFSSVQSLDRVGRRGDMRDDSAEILFQSFLREALVSSSGMGRDVHSLMLPIQHYHCRPRVEKTKIKSINSEFRWKMFR